MCMGQYTHIGQNIPTIYTQDLESNDTKLYKDSIKCITWSYTWLCSLQASNNKKNQQQTHCGKQVLETEVLPLFYFLKRSMQEALQGHA